MKEFFGIKGHLYWELRDEFGNLKQCGESDNLITSTGTAMFCGKVAGHSSFVSMSYGHCGTGVGATDASTNLNTMINVARTAVSTCTVYNDSSSCSMEVIVTFGAGVCTNADIDEFGLFPTSVQANNNMCAYNDNSGAGWSVNKAATDALTLYWKFIFTGG